MGGAFCTMPAKFANVVPCTFLMRLCHGINSVAGENTVEATGNRILRTLVSPRHCFMQPRSLLRGSCADVRQFTGLRQEHFADLSNRTTMRTLLILTALLSLALPTIAADTAASVQKTLQADYDSRDKAVARRDITATLAEYALDFVGVSRTGKAHSLAEERADFLATFALPAQPSLTQSVIEKLTVAKAGAEADVILHRHGTLTLLDAVTHTPRTVVLDGVYRDVWARRAGGWRLTREQAVSVTATVNGKPL